jgi:hypothetical protein
LPAGNEVLLDRLVELNAKRAAEEAAGSVRWLRPEFQKSGEGEQVLMETDADGDISDEVEEGSAKKPVVVQRPWPTGLTEQIKAVAEVFGSASRSLDIEGLAAHFSGRGRWRDRLPTLLDTLAALGRIRLIEGRWVNAT